jgi:hypothetical protein
VVIASEATDFFTRRGYILVEREHLAGPNTPRNLTARTEANYCAYFTWAVQPHHIVQVVELWIDGIAFGRKTAWGSLPFVFWCIFGPLPEGEHEFKIRTVAENGSASGFSNILRFTPRP